MTKCELVGPMGETIGPALFPRCPCVNERIVLDAIAAPAGVETWPPGLAGKRYHVGGVTWASAVPGEPANAVLFLTDDPVQP